MLLIREITDRKQLEMQLKELALRDALTGLYNRHYLDVTAAHDIACCRRRKVPLALVMFDLDHFKQVNDTYGHQAGDAVLQAFGAFLLSHARQSDFSCRYGGEEFVILMAGSSAASAVKRADSWCHDFGRMAIDGAPENLRVVTCSGGVAAFPDQGDSLKQLIRAADATLYRAKEQGRDCIATAGKCT